MLYTNDAVLREAKEVGIILTEHWLVNMLENRSEFNITSVNEKRANPFEPEYIQAFYGDYGRLLGAIVHLDTEHVCFTYYHSPSNSLRIFDTGHADDLAGMDFCCPTCFFTYFVEEDGSLPFLPKHIKSNFDIHAPWPSDKDPKHDVVANFKLECVFSLTFQEVFGKLIVETLYDSEDSYESRYHLSGTMDEYEYAIDCWSRLIIQAYHGLLEWSYVSNDGMDYAAWAFDSLVMIASQLDNKGLLDELKTFFCDTLFECRPDWRYYLCKRYVKKALNW